MRVANTIDAAFGETRRRASGSSVAA